MRYPALLALAFLGTIGAAPPPATAYQWQNVTVGGGGFAPGIVFSPVERGLAYLRTDMGGAYRRDSRSLRWEPLQDEEAESNFMGIESIAPDPHDPEVVYLAAGMSWRGPAAIFRSADRGAHWRKTVVPFAMGGNEDGRGLGERLAIDPHRTATLMFGSRHDGLWRSDDTGVHWQKVAAFPLAGLGRPDRPRTTHGGLSFVLFDPAQRGRVFVASADPGAQHLFRSDDGGSQWQAVAGGPAADLLPVKGVIGADSVLTLTYCDAIGPNGITRGAVWRFDPRSGAWHDVTPLKGAKVVPGGYMGVAVAARDPRVIGVATVNRYRPGDTVWRSADAGRTWRELARDSVRDVSATPFLDFDGKANFGHWIAGLAIDPFDAGHAAYVTGATVYATNDFAQSRAMRWAPWTRGIEQTAIITLVSPTGGAPLVSGFGDLGGFRHDDMTRSPRHVHRNPMLTNTNSLDYAGMAPLVMVRSGNTHKPVVPDTSLAWSTDGGDTWQPLRVPAQGGEGGEPSRAQTGSAAITVSADGETFVVETEQPLLTRDRGKNWSLVRGLPVRTRVTADKADARRFYAVDADPGHVLRSDDGGAAFHAAGGVGLPADLSGARTVGREAANPLVAVPGRAGGLWLLVGEDLYRSVDRGEHWARASQGIAITRFGLGKGAAGSDWPALYAIGSVGAQRGIYRSIDGGARWTRINDDAHQWGLRLRVISGDPRLFGRVYVGTDGRGIMYGDPVGR
ncbi:WD40/YVTN/BNR-like repeat-containing protein [Sphingomonas sp. NPDC079357]|uniref:WD40/YVTN/BNR-like repeat-containing protein n=1 Tax=Sphingomonas sp. NPDC079357 TaxID=3364518 RepID=UPI00384C6DBD